MKHYLSIWLLSLFAFSCTTTPTNDTFATNNEILIQQIPESWREVTSVQQDNLWIREVIPKDQDINNWEEILSTQIIAGGIEIGTEEFIANLNSSWAKTCTNAQTRPAVKTSENGYSTYFWLQTCQTNNPKTPKMTLFKAIEGQENFYLIQKSWYGNLTPESVKFWSQQMKLMQLCNTSQNDKSCTPEI